MDPLETFYNFHELIIQHFSFEDILSAWKVSTTWCKLVLEKNKFAMKKIKLKINDCNHDEIMELLQRKESKFDTKIFEILKTKRKYENIKIDIDHGWDYVDQIVRNLSNSLVDINVTSDIYCANLKIPNLKFLKLGDALLDGLTSTSNKLEKLSVCHNGKEFWLKKESPEAVRRALKENQKLKILEFDENLTELIFSENLSEISFNLEKFSASCSNIREIGENLRNFLSSQRDSIQHLSLGCIDSFTTHWIYKEMSKLKSLEVKIHFEENPQNFHLIPNSQIFALDLDITSFWQWSMNIRTALRIFIASTPNLEILILRMTSPET